MGCVCTKCGKEYTVDISISDDVWKLIKPIESEEGSGLLCGECIMTRIENASDYAHYVLSEKIEEGEEKESTLVNVRWFDGYLECFWCSEVRFGSDLLWMRLVSGENRHIPLRQVRWFSLDPENHAEKKNKGY
jgi:hypothetical protein